jgi:hypothetical protein
MEEEFLRLKRMGELADAEPPPPQPPDAKGGFAPGVPAVL